MRKERPVPLPEPASAPKREAILQAALGAFSRYGFRRAAVDDVAREAGVAKGTVYLYFDSKESLFRAVAQLVGERLLAGAEKARGADAPPTERLRLVLEAKFLFLHDVVARSPHAAELLDSKGKLAADLFEVVDRRYHALVAAVLAEGVEAGELDLTRAGLTPTTAAAFLVRVGHGLDAPDPSGGLPSRDVYRRRIAELVRVVVAGIGHPG